MNRTQTYYAAAALVLAVVLGACERESSGPSASGPAAPPSAAGRAVPVAAPVEPSRIRPPETDNCLPQATAEFGEYPLDAPFQAFPAERRPPVGRLTADGMCPGECHFAWEDGVEYWITDDHVSAKVLLAASTKSRLPLGLTADTDLAAARAALARHGVSADLRPQDSWFNSYGQEPPWKEGPILRAGLCEWDLSWIDLYFDVEGRLRAVEIASTVT